MKTRRQTTVARSRRGFTLVELMVVVAIIGIAATAAGVYLSSPRDKRAMSSSASAVSSLVQQLRNRAMSNGAAVILEIEETVALQDPETSTTVGRGSGQSAIRVYDSQGSSCLPQETDLLLPEVVLDPTDPQRPYRHAVITRVAPAGTNGILRLCFTPSGRVVDPTTARPVAAVGSSRFGGQAYIELRPALCDGGVCTVRPDRSTLAIEFNGLVEKLDDSFDIGGL